MFVAAMERDDWAMLGEPVYVRGFLRNYARLLELDAASLIDDLDREHRLVGPIGADSALKPEIASAQNHRWYPWLMWPMSAVAAVLVALVVWNFFGIALHGRQSPEALPPLAADRSVEAPPASRAVQPQAPRRGIDLRLSITQDSWLSVTVDGKRVIYKTLPAGTKRSFHGVREILLRAGNAGGVEAAIDGQQLGPLGSPGQVKDRTFAVKTAAMENRAHE